MYDITRKVPLISNSVYGWIKKNKELLLYEHATAHFLVWSVILLERGGHLILNVKV